MDSFLIISPKTAPDIDSRERIDNMSVVRSIKTFPKIALILPPECLDRKKARTISPPLMGISAFAAIAMTTASVEIFSEYSG